MLCKPLNIYCKTARITSRLPLQGDRWKQTFDNKLYTCSVSEPYGFDTDPVLEMKFISRKTIFEQYFFVEHWLDLSTFLFIHFLVWGGGRIRLTGSETLLTFLPTIVILGLYSRLLLFMLAKTTECWSLEFQLNKIFADNIGHICRLIYHLTKITRKYCNKLDSGVSARRLLFLLPLVVKSRFNE